MEQTLTAVLRDLYAHLSWADAEHWRALEACPAALEDGKIRERLVHIYQAQYWFLAVARGETPSEKSLPDLTTPVRLKEYARRHREEAAAFLGKVTPEMLAELAEIPGVKGKPPLAVGEALLQAVMHTQYHRAQIATRLRELGGGPPVTDYILWLWNGRPAP